MASADETETETPRARDLDSESAAAVSAPSDADDSAGPASLAKRLTLVITTSPTPSAPSTELLSLVLLSFREHCPALTECRVILVIDTYDHISSTPRLKKGHVTAEGARLFAEYKQNAKQLLLREYAPPGGAYGDHDLLVDHAEAEYGFPAHGLEPNAVPLAITKTRDGRVTFIEPSQRLGFGLAVRSALRLTETPYVWIQQHDWSLVSDIPLAPLLDVMQQQSEPEPGVDAAVRESAKVPVKYVCFPSVRMIQYAKSGHVVRFPALRALTNLHKQSFTVRSGDGHGDGDGDTARVPLTPLFFWHDKPHVAETAHYLARVFPTRLALPRGAFIEDTVGHRARAQMKEGQWTKWACWLYYPDEGRRLCVRHLKGRTWRGTEAELARKLEHMRLSQGSRRGRNGKAQA